MLYMDDKYSIFITKSNAGTTAVYAKWVDFNSSAYDYSKFMVADLINSEKIGTVNFKGTVISSDMTSLVPICFPSGTYAPKLFVTPYSQYVDYTGIIDVNGTKYAYDGYAALEL